MKLDFRIEIFKEGNLYVAVAPELNVSSFGKSQKEARRSLREAVALFLEECKRMGSLDDVLIEAGFKPKNKEWRSNDPLVTERMALGI
ncbi:MAG: type II toxin-antitoxin system HicB family antitoxin [Patescibacteria group bacterium]